MIKKITNKKNKTFQNKNIEDFSNSKFMQIVSLCWYKEVS